MKVLVTGGAGYVGSHVAAELKNQGHNVFVIDDYSSESWKTCYYKKDIYHIEYHIEGRIQDKERLDGFFHDWRFDAVIHLAAKTSVTEGEKNIAEYYDTNVLGTATLIEVMNKYKTPYLIYTSTAAVYGSSGWPSVEEHGTAFGTAVYARSKAAGEDVAHLHFKGRTLILRCFNVAGASPELHLGKSPNNGSVITSFVRQALDDAPLKIYGGAQIRDFVHVKDVAAIHVAGLRYLEQSERNQFINVGTGHGTRILDLAGKIGSACNAELSGEMLDRNTEEIPFSVANTERLAKVFPDQFQALKSLDQVISDEVEWQKLLRGASNS